MANEIWAAIIQAIPIAGAALVGWRGLSTWRTQLREGRQVELSERALAAAAQMFLAIRAVRSRRTTLSDEELAASLEAAVRRDIDERLNRAWTAFLSFQERYVLAGLYRREARKVDVASDVGTCLYDLTEHAKMMWASQDAGERALRVKERTAFYGTPSSDPIEDRLQAAEQALRDELRPIL